MSTKFSAHYGVIMKKIILMCTVPLMLTACTMTPEECDPKITDPGMLDKLGCVVSGSYSQRSEQKKQEIHDLAQEQHELSERVIALGQKRAELINNREAKLKELDALTNKLDEVEASLKQKQALSKTLQEKIAKVRASKEKAASTPDDASVMQKKPELVQVQNDLDDLIEAAAGE